jgi:hypothetical protein
VPEAHQIDAEGLAWLLAGFVDVVADRLELGFQTPQHRRWPAQVAVVLLFEQLDAVVPGGNGVPQEVHMAITAGTA